MDTPASSGLMALFVRDLLPPLITALAGLIGAALVALTKKLNAQGTASKKAQILSLAAHLADVVVLRLEATERPYIRAVTADGKISKEEAAKLATTALEQLRMLLTEDGLQELKNALGILAPSLDTYLSGLIEGAVARLPSSSTSQVALTMSAGATGVTTATPLPSVVTTRP